MPAPWRGDRQFLAPCHRIRRHETSNFTWWPVCAQEASGEGGWVRAL